MALAYAVRDRMLQRWISTAAAYTQQGSRTVAYLSAEFLMGPHLGNNLINLGIYDTARQAVAELGLDLDELLRQEDEPGLGNGGLGRLAACFLDSLATLQVPCMGYGIRYEFGIFQQEIVDGWQVEKTDKWLRFGNPWELVRPEWAVEVKFGGHTERYTDEHGRLRVRWVPARVVNRRAVRHADPRLPRQHRQHPAAVARRGARVVRFLDLQPRRLLRRGEPEGHLGEHHQGAVSERRAGPGQGAAPGAAVSSSSAARCRTCCASSRVQKIPPERFHEKFAVQLNDTHPSIAVAELMRLLVDEHALDWDRAWAITRKTFAYTNHTLLPEALERWPLELFGRMLPRHLEIIYEINARFLDEVRIAFFGDDAAPGAHVADRRERRALRAHGAPGHRRQPRGQRRRRAAHRAAQERRAARFLRLWPEKFSNKTNGVTPRRWMVLCQSAAVAVHHAASSATTGSAIWTNCGAWSR